MAESMDVRASAFKPEKPTLFDVPLSPFGAGLRFLIYHSGLEDAVDIRPPKDLGGLKSAEYMALHPAGKMPLLVLPSGQAIPESTVIQQYILDALATDSELVPATPEERAAAASVTRYMDMYYEPIMGCMYKPMDPTERAAKLERLNAVLDVLESLCRGPLFLGSRMTTADASAFPHFVFMTYMLPQFFGWENVFGGRPKLAAWWDTIQQDPVAARVIQEVVGGLEGWKEGGRWEQVDVVEQVKDSSFKWVYP